MDNDDEVRDRALLYLQVLRQKQKALSSTFILNRMWGVVFCMPVIGLEDGVGVAVMFVCLFPQH